MHEHKKPEKKKGDIERYLSIAVPLVSFGGIALAISLQYLGLIADAGEFFWGCVIGSVCLGYLAWIKPRRDIVALLAPLYAVLIFLVPLEMRPNLVLQVLFAISITILVVRLNKRFSSPISQVTEENHMEKYLYDYMNRISPYYRDMDRECAHEIASTVLSYKFGLYPKTMQSAEKALAMLPEDGAMKTLKKAVTIVADRAENLEESRVKRVSAESFSPEDEEYLAIVLPAESVEDRDELKLDNALLLLYAVGYLESPDDGQSLDEHQNFFLQILNSYKKALNI
jgi:hypothetical protein